MESPHCLLLGPDFIGIHVWLPLLFVAKQAHPSLTELEAVKPPSSLMSHCGPCDLALQTRSPWLQNIAPEFANILPVTWLV